MYVHVCCVHAECYERHAHTDEEHHGRPGRHMSVQERSAMIHGSVGHMLSNRSASELVRAGDSSSQSYPGLYLHPQEECGHN